MPPRVFEGRADDPLDAFPRIDVLLYGDLVGGTFLEDPTHADVEPLGILAEDDEVDLLGAVPLQRRQAIMKTADRAQVHEQVELETGAQQDVPGVAHVGYARVAQRTHEDRVEGLETLERFVGQRLARSQETLGTVGEGLQLHLDRVRRARRFEHLDRLAGYIHADAVARQDGESKLGHVGIPRSGKGLS